MLPNITVNKWLKSLLFICIIFYLYFIARVIHLRGYGDDDQVFLSIFNSGHITDLLIGRFNTWSGRFAIEWVMTVTIGHSFFWKIGIPLSVVIVCYSSCRISGLKFGIVPFSFALILFAAMPYDINIDASWWITGFYNYLLPVAAALYAFSVSFSDKREGVEKLICIILAFYFPYMEQAGIAFSVAIICVLYSKRKSLSAFDIIMMIIVFINLVISLKAPGNEKRFILEAWRWYPQYQTYGVINKLSLGFDKLHQLMTFRYNIPLIVFSSSLYLIMSKNNGMRLASKFAMFFIATFIAISIANSFTGIFDSGLLFNSSPIDATRWSAAKLYLSYLYISIVISSMFILMIEISLIRNGYIVSLVSMLIGFMTVTMMGLSPTVYASGYRVDFIFEVMCIISTLNLLSPQKVKL